VEELLAKLLELIPPLENIPVPLAVAGIIVAIVVGVIQIIGYIVTGIITIIKAIKRAWHWLRTDRPTKILLKKIRKQREESGRDFFIYKPENDRERVLCRYLRDEGYLYDYNSGNFVLMD